MSRFTPLKVGLLLPALLVLSACNLDLFIESRLESKIEVAISGPGSVSINQSLSECDAIANNACWITEYGRARRITPVADSGYEFAGWSGDCRGIGYCNIFTQREHHLSNNKSYQVNALFVPAGSLSLTNTSTDLKQVLEYGQTFGACDRYFDNINDAAVATEYLKLMCGKDMFFYEGFELLGVPEPMVDIVLNNAPNTMGPGFSNFGMIKDPYSSKGYSLGLVQGKRLSGVNSLAFGCASCHFAQTDGLYSVGQANQDYDYGKHIMSLTFIAMSALDSDLIDVPVAAEVTSYVQPAVNEVKSNLSTAALLFDMAPMLPLLSGGLSGLPVPGVETQKLYLNWKAGTQDFVIAPVGLEDNVETVSKMVPIFGLADLHGIADAKLGMTGSTPNLDVFIQDFIVLSLGADNYDLQRRTPLYDYILTLTPPANPNPAASADINAGEILFNTKGCAACHDGPRKSSTQLYTYAEIGTDEMMMQWADKDADGNSEVPELFQNGSILTHKIKAPKLLGMWTQKRFLHNGSVDSLEQLFCLPPNPMRPTINKLGFSDKGHMMTCTGDASNPTGTMSDDDKRKLIAYLMSL